jgi:hypothetical protein
MKLMFIHSGSIWCVLLVKYVKLEGSVHLFMWIFNVWHCLVDFNAICCWGFCTKVVRKIYFCFILVKTLTLYEAITGLKSNDSACKHECKTWKYTSYSLQLLLKMIFLCCGSLIKTSLWSVIPICRVILSLQEINTSLLYKIVSCTFLVRWYQPGYGVSR